MSSFISRRLVCIAVSVSTIAVHAQDGDWQRVAAPDPYVIVEFRRASHLSTHAAKESTLEAFRRDLGAFAGSSIRREYSVVFHGAALRVDRRRLPEIAALSYVEAIHPDATVDALSSRASASQRMRAQAIELGSRGQGVTVAILDSGIDYTHPALGGGFGFGYKIAGGYDFVNGDSDPRDDNGHGTHVAGIIAAESDEVTGIAPDTTLIAYKVLDATGSGRQSDVIAALEQVVDPNGDGDPSDHADIANLSFGGIGTPDDPQSKAVDAAVAAGVIVCAAAGNDGETFAIRSPGTARAAITVGALDNDFSVASFSSRGPSVRLASIKPDVLAPGVRIRSTFLGGELAVMDGTSMATPYVAGACALIRALHRDWTPLDVKTAITMTALRVDAGAMDRGGGALDLAAAAATSLLASESHFSFGLDATQNGTWEGSRSITVTNIADLPLTYVVAATTSDPAVTVRATPPAFRVAAGSTANITLSVRVDHDSGAPAEIRGGDVTLVNDDESLHFAWAVVTTTRATLSMDRASGSFYLLSFHAPRQPRWIASNAVEIYAPPGTYELVAIGYDAGENGATNAMLISTEITIAGDVAMQFTSDDVPHAIALRGTDDRGTPLVVRAGGEHYVSRFRVHAPPMRRFRGFEVLTGDGGLATNGLCAGYDIKAAEISVDATANRIVALQYAAIDSIWDDITMSSTRGDLQHQRIRLVFARGVARREISVQSVAIEQEEHLESLSSIAVAAIETFGSSWTGDVYLNEEADDEHVMSIALQAAEGGRSADLATPALRILGGRFIAANVPEPPPLAYVTVGEVATYGDGPVFLAPHVVASPSAFHTCMKAFGAAGESLPRAVEDGLLTVFDDTGQVVAEHRGGSIDIRLPPSGTERVEFATRALSTALQPMRATLSITADSSAASIASIAILDRDGTMTSTLRRGEDGALLFSAHDPIRIDATRVWFRGSGAAEWLPVSPLLVGGDATVVRFLASLTHATVRGGTIDLRISLTSKSGSTSVLTLEPAFTVGAGRSRAVGHR